MNNVISMAHFRLRSRTFERRLLGADIWASETLGSH